MGSAAALVIAAGVGVLSGTHTAIWGMYKDAVHEGFTVRTFVRSIIIGAGVAIIVQLAFRLSIPTPGALVLLFGLAYAGERAIVEIWKTFFRDEDQSKYFIPMQFHVFGTVIHSRAQRLAVGIPHVLVIFALLVLIVLPGTEAIAPTPKGFNFPPLSFVFGSSEYCRHNSAQSMPF